eukprot:419132-Rhodomonas_salina.1
MTKKTCTSHDKNGSVGTYAGGSSGRFRFSSQYTMRLRISRAIEMKTIPAAHVSNVEPSSLGDSRAIWHHPVGTFSCSAANVSSPPPPSPSPSRRLADSVELDLGNKRANSMWKPADAREETEKLRLPSCPKSVRRREVQGARQHARMPEGIERGAHSSSGHRH